MTSSSSFIVLKQTGFDMRVYGPYRSFKRAEADALAWGAVVIPVEDPSTACEPWNAKGKPWQPKQAKEGAIL